MGQSLENCVCVSCVNFADIAKIKETKIYNHVSFQLILKHVIAATEVERNEN